MTLYWGQISPANFQWLTSYYGGPPPWSMDKSPHLSLVRAVMESTDPTRTPYYDYLRATHEHPARDLARQFAVVASLLDAPRLDCTVEAGCVVDGNHRHAVATVTGKSLKIDERQPYQTVLARDEIVDGRRLPGRIPDTSSIDGETVLDAGTAQGSNAITAARHGAKHVYAIDARLTSVNWRLSKEWGLDDRITWIPADANTFAVPDDVTVVFALSVRQHLKPDAFAALLRGRKVLLETHNDHETPPDTGHRWTQIGTVPYSRAEPARIRRLYWGTP